MIPHTFPFHRVAPTALFLLFFCIHFYFTHTSLVYLVLLVLLLFDTCCSLFTPAQSVGSLVTRGYSSMQKGGVMGGLDRQWRLF